MVLFIGFEDICMGSELMMTFYAKLEISPDQRYLNISIRSGYVSA